MSIEMKKAEIIKANFTLQEKVGKGSIDKHIIEKCQAVIDEDVSDFAPLAEDFLKTLSAAIKDAKKGDTPTELAIQNMADPVMQLKANAAMFKYDLVSSLANIMLSFLESVNKLDKDMLEIVEAHYKTLSAIVIKKMKGTGGESGKRLEGELKDACKRYFSKKPKPKK